MFDFTVSNLHIEGHRTVANQFVIEREDGTYFQSHQTVIAFKPKASSGVIYVDPDWHTHSQSTSKYTAIFLSQAHGLRYSAATIRMFQSGKRQNPLIKFTKLDGDRHE